MEPHTVIIAGTFEGPGLRYQHTNLPVITVTLKVEGRRKKIMTGNQNQPRMTQSAQSEPAPANDDPISPQYASQQTSSFGCVIRHPMQGDLLNCRIFDFLTTGKVLV